MFTDGTVLSAVNHALAANTARHVVCTVLVTMEHRVTRCRDAAIVPMVTTADSVNSNVLLVYMDRIVVDRARV